ncbi:hypothetical protein D3C71_1231050 [compost metagenome]
MKRAEEYGNIRILQSLQLYGYCVHISEKQRVILRFRVIQRILDIKGCSVRIEPAPPLFARLIDQILRCIPMPYEGHDPSLPVPIYCLLNLGSRSTELYS